MGPDDQRDIATMIEIAGRHGGAGISGPHMRVLETMAQVGQGHVMKPWRCEHCNSFGSWGQGSAAHVKRHPDHALIFESTREQ